MQHLLLFFFFFYCQNYNVVHQSTSQKKKNLIEIITKTLIMVDGAIPVRSFLDVPREATHKRLRNVSELAAFVQSAPFSSTLPFGFETTPADRETT